jgi:type VI protein secretion system component Hcp
MKKPRDRVRPSPRQLGSDQLSRITGGAVETREHVSFTYQKIIWTYVDGGITAEDDWEAPVV